MTFTLLAGILAAFLLTTFVAAAQRAPTRSRCPECGSETETVQSPLWLRRGIPGVRLRWCASCSWEGLGRAGAEWVPGRRVSHDSGFHWGDERLPEDFGFRFAHPPAADPSGEPPHHPSGFRFGGDETNPKRAAHPSGFDWGGRVGRPPFAAPARPPRFRWKDAG